ncbi:MAG TPA: outer membrane lipoprotein-sorting protein [Candidatus Acidoferrales bacterium]|nr:outer membrane lipoprotein-sorting protein [Candidatus Acidoferrales bacterium]
MRKDSCRRLKIEDIHGRRGALIALILLPIFALMGAAAFAGGQSRWTVDSALKQLDSQAKSFRSLTANIERTKVTLVVNDKSTESGTIAVRHDDKMRIEFTQPDPRTILRSGNELYLYNPKIKRVEQYDLGKRRSLVDQFLLLGFGTSGTEMQKGYLVTLLGEEQMDNRQVLKLELTPKSEEVRNQVSKIHIWIDESTWLPAQQQFFETGSGDYLLIRYTNVVRNVRLTDTDFKPHWPKGVTHFKP